MCRIEGLGPVTAQTVRDWLGRTDASVTLQPVVLPDPPPVDGYEIPQAIRDALAARHPASVYPWSQSAGPAVDLDHTTAYVPLGEGRPARSDWCRHAGSAGPKGAPAQDVRPPQSPAAGPGRLLLAQPARLGLAGHQHRHSRSRPRPRCRRLLASRRTEGRTGTPTDHGSSSNRSAAPPPDRPDPPQRQGPAHPAHLTRLATSSWSRRKVVSDGLDDERRHNVGLTGQPARQLVLLTAVRVVAALRTRRLHLLTCSSRSTEHYWPQDPASAPRFPVKAGTISASADADRRSEPGGTIMRWTRTITVVDCHAEGESGQVVVGGVPPVPGDTVFDKRVFLQDQADDLRRMILFEPRGAPHHNANILVPVQPSGGPDGLHHPGVDGVSGHVGLEHHLRRHCASRDRHPADDRTHDRAHAGVPGRLDHGHLRLS